MRTRGCGARARSNSRRVAMRAVRSGSPGRRMYSASSPGPRSMWYCRSPTGSATRLSAFGKPISPLRGASSQREVRARVDARLNVRQARLSMGFPADATLVAGSMPDPGRRGGVTQGAVAAPRTTQPGSRAPRLAAPRRRPARPRAAPAAPPRAASPPRAARRCPEPPRRPEPQLPAELPPVDSWAASNRHRAPTPRPTGKDLSRATLPPG